MRFSNHVVLFIFIKEDNETSKPCESMVIRRWIERFMVKRMKYLSSQKICGLNLKSVGGRQQFGVARLVTTPDLLEPNTVLYHSKFQEHGCPNHPTPRRPLIRWALVAMGHAASTIFMFQPHQGKGFKVKPKFVMMFILQVPAFSERDLNVRNHTNLDRLDVTSRDLNCRLLTK